MSYKKYSDLQDRKPVMGEINNHLCPDLKTVEEKQTHLQKHSNLCVVDVYATWCSPCKQIAPIFNELSKKYEDRCGFAKEDVSASLTTGILGVPSFIFYKDGKQIDRITGADMKALETKINLYI